MSFGSANFTPEGRRSLMLKGPVDAWKEVRILCQSKVSTAIGKQSISFVQKATGGVAKCWTNG